MATTQIPPAPTSLTGSLDSNRRQGFRHTIDVPASLASEQNPHERFQVRVVDVSISGIGIHGRNPLVVGQIYQLRAFDTLLPPGTRVKIIGCRSLGADGFDIGGQIVG